MLMRTVPEQTHLLSGLNGDPGPPSLQPDLGESPPRPLARKTRGHSLQGRPGPGWGYLVPHSLDNWNNWPRLYALQLLLG